jgi:hypothetical protein
MDFLPIGVASDSDVVFYFGEASRDEWRSLPLGCHGKKEAHTFGALAGFPAHAEMRKNICIAREVMRAGIVVRRCWSEWQLGTKFWNPPHCRFRRNSRNS